MQKKLAVLALVVAAGLSTSACVIIDADDGGKRDVSVKINDGNDALEPLYGVALEKGELVARVSSNGCTKAEDFKVVADRRESGVAVTLTRERPDLCRALVPEGKELRFDLDAMGVQRTDKVRVRNLLQRA